MNAHVNIDKLKAIRDSLKVGFINVPEIDEFLQRLEMQLPDSPKRKPPRPTYINGKLNKTPRY